MDRVPKRYRYLNDENKSESTHAISGMSTDTISATATETVWKSRAGLKVEKLKSVTISIPEYRASVAMNAEMTAAVSGPEFDLTSKLKFESMTQMPEPKLKTTSRISAENNQRGSELRSEPPKSEQITKAVVNKMAGSSSTSQRKSDTTTHMPKQRSHVTIDTIARMPNDTITGSLAEAMSRSAYETAEQVREPKAQVTTAAITSKMASMSVGSRFVDIKPPARKLDTGPVLASDYHTHRREHNASAWRKPVTHGGNETLQKRLVPPETMLQPISGGMGSDRRRHGAEKRGDGKEGIETIVSSKQRDPHVRDTYERRFDPVDFADSILQTKHDSKYPTLLPASGQGESKPANSEEIERPSCHNQIKSAPQIPYICRFLNAQ